MTIIIITQSSRGAKFHPPLLLPPLLFHSFSLPVDRSPFCPGQDAAGRPAKLLPLQPVVLQLHLLPSLLITLREGGREGWTEGGTDGGREGGEGGREGEREGVREGGR